MAAANGLGADGALRAVTIDAAKLLGIDQTHGSIEPGKTADLVLYDCPRSLEKIGDGTPGEVRGNRDVVNAYLGESHG